MRVFQILTLDKFKTWLDEQHVTRKITLIQNHHTWLPGYKEWNKKPDANHWMNSMETTHIQRNFGEIAQQFSTFADGTIAIGRSMDRKPTGIKGANSNGICLEHVGCFDLGGDVMTPAHSHTIVTLNALLINKFKLQVNTNTIQYHHWWDLDTGKRTNGTGNVKTCPGTNFFGGNTVEACEKNFLPLINNAL